MPKTAARREKTILGVAPVQKATAARDPIREASQQEPPPEGWDLPEPATIPRSAMPTQRDPSIAIDLSELEVAPSDRVAARPTTGERSLVPAGVPRRHGFAWFMALLVLALAVVGYVQRDTLLPLVKNWELRLMGSHAVAALRRLPVWAATPAPSTSPPPAPASPAHPKGTDENPN
jgi:hypothetical protein